MQCVTKLARIPHPNPNTFAGLMEMYEHNYIKIRKLCGDFNKLQTYTCSQVDKGMDLHLEVVERTRYTITLNLTYKFTSLSHTKPVNLPNIFIRVYFDAMQAEVLHRVTGRFSENVKNLKHLSNKWKDNRFLYKWLGFCIVQGHTFIHEDCKVDN